MTRPLAVAHRGYSARYPENTLLSAGQAIAAGCDLVEADARLAADGTVWCVHDPDLRRLAGQSVRIAEASSQILADVILPGGERLTTLAHLLDHVAGRVPVLIDVKTTDIQTVLAVVRTVQEAGPVDRVWFGLRAADQVARVMLTAPGARCLGFVPSYDDAGSFVTAGVQAVRVWEGHMNDPSAACLFGAVPVWVTAGGYDTDSAPGDVTESRLACIIARGAAAVLLNDPTLLTRRRLAS